MPADGPWLTESQLRTWVSLIAFLEVLPAAIDAQLRADLDVNRFEYSLLAMLSEEADETLVMSDLASVSFGSLSRLSHAVGRLEKRGWVERREDARSGRRRTTVSLTAAGRRAVVEVAPKHAAHVRSVLIEPLTDDDVSALGTIARKLVAAADPTRAAQLDALLPAVVARNLGSATALNGEHAE
ncbi:MAG: MarR family transcriptional regulator [Actinomycetota bacterium]